MRIFFILIGSLNNVAAVAILAFSPYSGDNVVKVFGFLILGLIWCLAAEVIDIKRMMKDNENQ